MGYRKADNTDPNKLLARGLAWARQAGQLPQSKHLTPHNGLPSYQTIIRAFGSVSAYQGHLQAALDTAGTPVAQPRRLSLASAQAFEGDPRETLGCNLVAVTERCDCDGCRAYKTPARTCRCTGEAGLCAACRAYQHRQRTRPSNAP